MIDLQKASLSKRFSAYLLDFICVCILATMFAWLFSLAVDFNGWYEKYVDTQARYEEKYGINSLTSEEYAALSEDEKKAYDEKNQLAMEEAEKALQAAYNAKDPEAVETVKVINMVNNLITMTVTFSLLFGVLVVEFILPIIFKNGQTLGKKVFSVAVMRTNSVKINNVCLFVRSILGKYAIETMIPAYIAMKLFLGSANIFDLLLVLALFVSQLIIMAVTKNNSLIHDLLSDTVVVDMSSQLIFDTEESMLKFKENLHDEKVNSSTY